MKEENNLSRSFNLGAIVRGIILVVFVGVFITMLVKNSPKNEDLNTIWDGRTTVGKKDAKNHFTMMTDIMCPYCDYFSRAVMKNQVEFEKYLAEKDIVFEVRITDFLYEFGSGDKNSELSAEAAQCATEEGKFWEFYHVALSALDEDYHSKGIGNSKTSPKIDNMSADYWEKVAEKAGLSDAFKSCYREHKTLDKVKANTMKVAKLAQKSKSAAGMPYFKFNDFETSGFDTGWGWEQVKMYFEAGLKKK